MAKSIACPNCKFPNFAGAAECLLCKTSLEGVEAVELDASERTEDEAVAYLCCHPFPPEPLYEGARLSLGRTRKADITLPHHSISRRHGAVSVAAGVVRFEDLSSNGSFINGKRVEGSVDLRPGDVLTLGPYDLEIVSERPPASEEDDAAENTSELDFTSLMSGLLEETSIFEVLQGLEYNGKTGTLSLIAGRLRGTLVVREGQPWSATLGDLRDEDAVLRMTELEEGRFIFHSTVGEGPRTMDTRLTALLLEASRQRDEHATQLDVDPPTLT